MVEPRRPSAKATTRDITSVTALQEVLTGISFLNWLKRYAMEPGEAPPLGMILCAGKSEEHVELLELAKSGIHVGSYWTELLPKKELERKLHEAVLRARARLRADDSAEPPTTAAKLAKQRTATRRLKPKP